MVLPTISPRCDSVVIVLPLPWDYWVVGLCVMFLFKCPSLELWLTSSRLDWRVSVKLMPMKSWRFTRFYACTCVLLKLLHPITYDWKTIIWVFIDINSMSPYLMFNVWLERCSIRVWWHQRDLLLVSMSPYLMLFSRRSCDWGKCIPLVLDQLLLSCFFPWSVLEFSGRVNRQCTLCGKGLPPALTNITAGNFPAVLGVTMKFPLWHGRVLGYLIVVDMLIVGSLGSELISPWCLSWLSSFHTCSWI